MLRRLMIWLVGLLCDCPHLWREEWLDGVGFIYRCQRCRLCRPYQLPGWPFHGGGETAAHS